MELVCWKLTTGIIASASITKCVTKIAATASATKEKNKDNPDNAVTAVVTTRITKCVA